jgi:hypothetical protein
MPRGCITWLRCAREVRRAPQVLDSLPPRPVRSLALHPKILGKKHHLFFFQNLWSMSSARTIFTNEMRSCDLFPL